MARSPTPRRASAHRTSARLLAAAIVIACVIGLSQFLDPLEIGMRAARDKIRSHPASGKLVIVAIDNRSLAEIGPAPWSNARLAKLLARLHDAGAHRIHLDIDVATEGASGGDHALEAEARREGRALYLPVRVSSDVSTGNTLVSRPPAWLSRHASMVNTALWVRWSYVWSVPYAVEVDGKPMATLASRWGNVPGPTGMLFPIDSSIDIRSIPTISASDVIDDRLNRADVAGNDVIVAMTSAGVQQYGALGYGMVPSAYLHVIAIETLRSGKPWALGLPASIAFATVFASIFLLWNRRGLARLALMLGFAGLILGPLVLEQRHVFVTITPALALLTFVAVARLWGNFRRSYQARGTTNAVSGLPNLEAMRQTTDYFERSVVLARILNFSEVLIALPAGSEREMVEQIVKRLKYGASDGAIYQSNEGVFFWLDESADDDALADQLGALHALFRSPVIVAGRLIDLTVTFGLDHDAGRTVVQRVSSALVAAEKAASEGQRWMTYDPAELEDAEWRMSLLARLDQAIDNGEIWVAYQPKIDIATRDIIGVEALARWTHPEKGDIPPIQFIAAAERSGRIDRLTEYVLEAAVAAAATINRRNPGFSVAVNLSPRLLDRPQLVEMIAAVLARHALPPHLLFLEITETMAMADQEQAVKTIHELAATGIRLSIDDYGTGFSTLEYLRMIPAEEIKIDRSFISMLEKSQSDRIMVHSTIQLAHSLGRRVVAEGVENAATLSELRAMNCDYVQGYHTGRPARLPALLELLDQPRLTAAA